MVKPAQYSYLKCNLTSPLFIGLSITTWLVCLYVFAVNPALTSGFMSNGPAKLAFIVDPVIWPAARLPVAASLLFAGLVYSAYRYHVYHCNLEKQTRRSISRDLHDDLSSTLSSITFFAEALTHSPDPGKREHFVELIKASSEEAKEKVSDIVWSIHPGKDTWSDVTVKCKRFAADLFDSRKIVYSIREHGIPERAIDCDDRKNFWLMFKEVVTNIVKHSNAGKVRIHFNYCRGVLMLDIMDDGCGFHPDMKTKGNGMTNIRSRCADLGGHCKLQSAPDKGTRWKFQLPVRVNPALSLNRHHLNKFFSFF